MQIYCSECKKHTDNVYPKNLVMMTNKVIKGTSKCADCMAIKSFSDKLKHKSQLEIFVSIFNWLNLIKQNSVKCKKILKI